MIMASLTTFKRGSQPSPKSFHKSYSWDGVRPDCIKEVPKSTNTSVPTQLTHKKRLKHTADCSKMEDTKQHVPEHRTLLDESNLFMIKTICVWILICLPGNIFALTIFFKHEDKPKIYGQLNEYVNVSSSFSHDSQINPLQSVELINEPAPKFTNDSELGTNLESENQKQEENKPHPLEVTHCYEYLDRSLENTRSRLRFWIEGVVIFIIGCLGFIGNVITVLVLRGYRKNRNFHILIICLTVADSILILDSVWQKSIVQHFMSPPEWYNKTYPYLWHPLKGMSLSATIFMVIAVSAERFRAVCHPMSRHHSPSKFIVFVVTISIMTKLPRFFQFELRDDGTDYRISDMMGDPMYIRFTSYWDDIFVTGVIPLLLLLYFNLKLYFKIRTSKNMRHMRHFGRQSTRISSHVAHSAVHNSVKGNNAHNETKLSKDIVTSSMISEMDHGTSEKDLSANQSVHFKEQHRNCILTTQRDGVSTLCISENIDRNTQVRSNSKKPRRRIDRSISTTNTRNQTYTKHVSSTTKCHGPKKHTDDVRQIGDDSKENSKRYQPIDGEKKLTQIIKCEIPSKLGNNNTGMTAITTDVQLPKTISEMNAERKCLKTSSREGIRKRFSTGKSTLILVVIVAFFVITHSNRLALKVYMSAFPQLNTKENFATCLQQGRYHVPFALYVLQHLSNMFIVLNSSVNFIIYCCVAKGFRERAVKIFGRRLSRRLERQSSFV